MPTDRPEKRRRYDKPQFHIIGKVRELRAEGAHPVSGWGVGKWRVSWDSLQAILSDWLGQEKGSPEGQSNREGPEGSPIRSDVNHQVPSGCEDYVRLGVLGKMQGRLRVLSFEREVCRL